MSLLQIIVHQLFSRDKRRLGSVDYVAPPGDPAAMIAFTAARSEWLSSKALALCAVTVPRQL
jgi:hypothetical protein